MVFGRTRSCVVLALSLGLTLLADETSAQSGVSDDRVSVPDGPSGRVVRTLRKVG